MNIRRASLIATTLVAGLLTGCGQAPMTASMYGAPMARVASQAMVSAATHAVLPSQLTLDDVTSRRANNHETLTVEAHSGEKAETLVFTTIFPYYVPMYSAVIVNGCTLSLDKTTSVSLDDVMRRADTSNLSPAAKEALGVVMYGLDFKAGHPSNP